MADETYYSLLEIPETASAAEIKSAYRRLIVDVHPDRLLNVSAYVRRLAEEKAKEINEAKEILLDTKRRRSYDEQLATYRTSQAPENGAHPTQSSAPSSSTSSQQQAQSASRSQGTSGTSTGSTQAPGPTSQQHQAASTSKSGFGSGNAMSSKTNSVGLHIRWPFWAWIGVIVLFAIVATIANQDTHYRGQNDHSATNAQISQVKIIDGSLSDTTVSGNSNERYGSAYNFSGHIQNNSSMTVSFIRMKIHIFDCQDMGAPGKVIEWDNQGNPLRRTGMYDPAPPPSCKKIGEEEEDDFPGARPGQSIGFANFYFPIHPKGGLRWNYEITKMDTQHPDASAPNPPKAEDVYYGVQSWPGPSRDYVFPDGKIITTPPGYGLVNNDDGTPRQFGKEGFEYSDQAKIVVLVKEHVGAKVFTAIECGTWPNGTKTGVCGLVKPIAPKPGD